MFGKGAYKDEQNLADDFKFNDKNKALIRKERKTKPDTWARPHNAFYFFEKMDRFRNIAYHEFGHQDIK